MKIIKKEDKPRIGIGIMIFKNGKILLGRKNDNVFAMYSGLVFEAV